MLSTDYKIERMTHQYKYSIITCARWEQECIIEWIEYYRSICFDHFYIYSNDDSIAPLHETLQPYLLGKEPLVTLRHYPFQGFQKEMYLHFLSNFRHETEWVAFFDVDEFVALKGVNNIQEFMKEFEHTTNSVYFNWIQFGNSGFEKRPAGSVMKNYTRRQNAVHPYTKNITKTESLDPVVIRDSRLHGFWHGWDRDGVSGSALLSLDPVNVLGHSMKSYYKNFPNHAEQYISSQEVQQALHQKAIIRGGPRNSDSRLSCSRR